MLNIVDTQLVILSFVILPIGLSFKKIYHGLLSTDINTTPTRYVLTSVISALLTSPVAFLGVLYLKKNYGVFRSNFWAEIIVFGTVAVCYELLFEFIAFFLT